jgi:hypothetical protein
MGVDHGRRDICVPEQLLHGKRPFIPLALTVILLRWDIGI